MIHANSKRAYHEQITELSMRSRLIYLYLTRLTSASTGLTSASTDRQIKEGLGLTDMNSVRPRITELIAEDWAEECGYIQCPSTHKRVRLVRALSQFEHDQRQAAKAVMEEEPADLFEPAGARA